MRYNSERIELLEKILVDFLNNPCTDLDITKEVRRIYNEERRRLSATRKEAFKEIKKELFRHKCVLLHNIPQEFVLEYILHKFSPFSAYFEDVYGINFHSLYTFAFKLKDYLEYKKCSLGFLDEVYKFKSKKEYADLGFVSIPSRDYIKNWSNIITFSVKEMKRLLPEICEKDVEGTIDILSRTVGEGNVDIHLKPLLRLDRDTFILLNPNYIIRGLPSIYEFLFKKVRKYVENKGKTFEKLVQLTIKNLPFKLLAYNVEYGKDYETDAFIKFNKSAWFVEVTSHPPSSRALEGDSKSIKRDLEKSVKRCIRQGERGLENSYRDPLKTLSANTDVKGVIVVLDGTYPQLNMNVLFSFYDEKPFPIYVINWFDLRTLVDQPEVNRFEDFLLWRTGVKPMPILCFDEKDYWAFYFDNYITNRSIRRSFKYLLDKRITVLYISQRFNRKEYLEHIKGK